MSRRVGVVAVVGMAMIALAGCAVPAAPPTPSPSATAAAATTPTASPTAIAAAAGGFTVPTRCDDLVSPALAAQLAAYGAGTPQIPEEGQPVGAPLGIPNYGPGDPTAATVTDYLICDWGAGDSLVEVVLARADAESYPAFAAELRYWDYGISATADALIWASDGDIRDSAGVVTTNIGSSDYWALRPSSMIKVQVRPGSPAALQQAIAISNDVAATTGAR